MTKLSLQVFIQKTISEYEFWTKACEWLRKTTAVLIISPRAATVSLHTFEFQLAKLHIRDSKNYSKFANDREQAGPEYSLISISKWIYWRRKKKTIHYLQEYGSTELIDIQVRFASRLRMNAN